MKAREVESELSKKLLDETTPEELEKINMEMANGITQTAVTSIINFCESKLKNDVYSHKGAYLSVIKFCEEQAKKNEKQQHGKTWDNAIEAHEQRGHVKSRSICDFDEYWKNNFD